MDLLDEVAKHALGGVEIGDDAVLERADRDNVAGRASDHPLGLCTDCQDAASVAVDRNNRGLVEDDASTPHIDKRVCGA